MLDFRNHPLPCKDCPNKGCGSYHDECEDLKRALEEQERIKQNIKKDRYVDNYIRESVSRAVMKGKR